ncbi:endonuclease/exonuclease/phosphatase family protein [Bacteroides sp.]
MGEGLGVRLLFLSLLFLSPSLHAQKGTFRVMFWNVENLFDTRHDSLKNDKEFLPDASRHWTYSRYKKKLANVARGITAVGGWTPPALVGLCEVENDNVLRDLTLYSPLKEQGYRYVMSHSADERGIDVALLYQPDRFKLISANSLFPGVPTFPSRPTRDILHVSGQLLTGDTLDLLVAHLPSRSGGAKQSEPYRLFVARKIKATADSLLSVRLHPKLIIMGDFNDYPTNQSVAKVLNATIPPAQIEPKKLYHLLARKAKATYFGSYKYRGKWGLLDHLIVSGTLLNPKENLFTNEEKANIARLPFLLTEDEKYGNVQPFRTYNGMKYQDGYSDHLPVYTDFQFTQSEY